MGSYGLTIVKNAYKVRCERLITLKIYVAKIKGR